VILPKAPDLGVLLVRTDYSDDAAWQAAVDAAATVYEADDFERMGARLQLVESPELAHLGPQDLARLPREGYLSELAVADARTMEDQTVLFVDLNELNQQVGRAFRSIPQEVEPIVANLSISNMNFSSLLTRWTRTGSFEGSSEAHRASDRRPDLPPSARSCRRWCASGQVCVLAR
jgi:hypothetical protein